MEDTVSVEKYNSMMDTLHEVCEVYKKQRDDARKESAMYKEWWLTSAANESKLTSDLEKANDYSSWLQDENMSLNDQLAKYTDVEYLHDDDDVYDDLDSETIGVPESANGSVAAHFDAIDAMLNAMSKSMANSTIKDES